MSLSSGSNSGLARAMLAGAWGILGALILAAPVLASHSWRKAASLIYLSYSSICHQIPERSFSFRGYPLAVCHRCSGIYLGLFLGALLENPCINQSPKVRRFWVVAASVPLLLDALLPYAGLWVSSGPSRFFTGLVLGTLISSLLVRGLTEFLNELHAVRFRRPAFLAREMFHE